MIHITFPGNTRCMSFQCKRHHKLFKIRAAAAAAAAAVGSTTQWEYVAGRSCVMHFARKPGAEGERDGQQGCSVDDAIMQHKVRHLPAYFGRQASASVHIW